MHMLTPWWAPHFRHAGPNGRGLMRILLRMVRSTIAPTMIEAYSHITSAAIGLTIGAAFLYLWS